MKYGLIGEKLGHSFSAVIHGMIGLYDYVLCPVSREDFDAFMTKRDFQGINVTIPYKKDVIPYLKELSTGAKLCGAVNTIVNRNGELYGDNTDFLGMQALLHKADIRVNGKNVLILGSGGTSGTALALMKHLGAAKVQRVSRSGAEGFLTYEQAHRCSETQIIINTTPCGMYPNIDETMMDLDAFPQLEGIVDAVYNPLKSRLVLDGEKRGIPAVGGLYMLVSQAVFAAQIFTGREDVISRTDELYDALVAQKRNVVLTGMPTSGKTTIGKLLAERLDRPFYDIDSEIIKKAGKSVSDIFLQNGEEAFRDMETEVIRTVSANQGVVIATGGGAPLREENIRLLKSNGIIYFLDAKPDMLEATADRPLSSTPEQLRQRYEERYPIYISSCDRSIPVSRVIGDDLQLLEKELL